MNDMLTAFHLVRHFELRSKEQEPFRECLPAGQYSVGLRLFRKLWRGQKAGLDVEPK